MKSLAHIRVRIRYRIHIKIRGYYIPSNNAIKWCTRSVQRYDKRHPKGMGNSSIANALPLRLLQYEGPGGSEHGVAMGEKGNSSNAVFLSSIIEMQMQIYHNNH